MKLYDYQEEGVRFLMRRKRAYLADVPGLGKTAQALVAAKRAGLVPVVIAPAVAVPVWWAEAEKWGVEVADVMSYTKLAMTKPEIAIDLYRDADLIILDEAHYVKSPTAKRTKAALRIAAGARRAWLLSGSPMPNDPTELWTVMAALWPERIPMAAGGGFKKWRSHFTNWSMVDYGYRRVPKIWGVKNGAELRSILKGIMLRRHVSDVSLQLPPLRLHVVPLPADAAFARELQAYDPETPELRRLLGAHKAPRIAKLLLEENNWPAVVMYHHKDTGRLLRTTFAEAGLKVNGFDGSTPQAERAYEVDEFQAGGRDVFVVQQQAGGVAITLTAASEIVLVEPDWSPEVNAQAIKRVHRISQRNPVRARIFKVEESLDDGIMEGLARKIAMRKEILS